MIALNDAIRRLFMLCVPPVARVFTKKFERRIDGYAAAQAELRTRYGVTAETPIRGYDDVTRASVEAVAGSREDTRLAYTSGSTSKPKALAYPRERLRSFKDDSRSAGVRAWASIGIQQPSIFVLSSLANDDSFTSLAVYQKGEPDRITGIIEPARYLFSPALAPRLERFGPTAVRLWLMTLANPGLIYSTNPSTLAVFLSELHESWADSTAMVRAWIAADASAKDRDTQRVARRVGSRGWRDRMQACLSEAPPPMSELLPGLSAYCCWDGGYVTSFLDQIHRWLPPSRYTHVPMYAMSTETIETLTWFDTDGTIRFLPVGPGVLYEFLPEGAPDEPQRLLRPDQLEPHAAYTMVVSDPYGLKRYQTEDLFGCEAMIRGIPDLRFLRRRGLTWSFTGEKLTGEQLTEAYQRLEAQHPELTQLAAQLTTLPSWPSEDAVPRYHLLVGRPGEGGDAPEPHLIAGAFDEALCAVNNEYADKRKSGRLAPPDVSILPYAQIAAALSGGGEGERSWESQFKLTPLTRKTMQDVELS